MMKGVTKFVLKDVGDRIALETKIMGQFLIHQSEPIREYSRSEPEEFQKEVEQILQLLPDLLSTDDSNNYLNHKESIQHILSQYNHNVRLQAKDKRPLEFLGELENSYTMKLLPPPMPSELLFEDVWQSEPDKWIGHGYYWKSGSGPMGKDLFFTDYDILETGFHRLSNAQVLLADYPLLKSDFGNLAEKSVEEINQWLVDQVGFLSEGQIKRMKPGGDLFDLIEPIDDKISSQNSKIGLRMKGGGRAASFLVNDEYHWDDQGLFQADMLEVKGIGTCILQEEFELKACGLLSLVDALKEFAYEKLLQRISKINNQPWGTVQYYAIIDTGLRFKANCKNPATGYPGDRCVLVVRQRQSRVISCSDEIVYYSVVRRELLENNRGKAFCDCLASYGISSEQLPQILASPNEFSLEGDWNVQSDAALSHIVDFSHFFVLPSSNLHHNWKLSQKAQTEALLLGAERFESLSNPNLFKTFASDSQQATEIHQAQIKDLQLKYEPFGVAGQRKPSYSWSWFLEVDDSQIMQWAYNSGTSQLTSPDDNLMEKIQSILPQ